jgi:hypothetical protein
MGANPRVDLVLDRRPIVLYWHCLVVVRGLLAVSMLAVLKLDD